MERIAVALSGGVDSAVSAALLQQQGYAVEAVFMKNWVPVNSQNLADCPWEQDQADAEAVAKQLGIPFRSINFEQEYRKEVVDYLVQEYAAGRTPNPDILCNSQIKFAALWKALQGQGIAQLATGHYAQLIEGKLRRGKDPKKDQSYFLYRLTKDQLAGVQFPVGGLEKVKVRELAKQFKLPNQAKKDSQGICFIGHLDIKDFLKSELGENRGPLYLLPSYRAGDQLLQRQRYAKQCGEHLGVAFHTIGERMGHYLDNRLYRLIRGDSQVPSTFVVSKDIDNNRVYISDRHDDPHLSSSSLQIENPIVTGGNSQESIIDVIGDRIDLTLQTRYQQPPVKISAVKPVGDTIHLTTAEPVWAPAIGQSVVIYADQTVLGGGILCVTN